MNKAMGIMPRLVVSLVLFSALTMSQAGANSADRDKNEEHHSRLAKIAFWRHHKDAGKNAKPAEATQVPAKPAQTKTSNLKPVSAKQVAGKRDQKQEQLASKTRKPSTKKAPTANKTKPRQKAQDPKTVSQNQF